MIKKSDTCTSHSRMKMVTTLCLLLVLITACGQRGPLYLPDKSPTTAPAQDQQPAGDELPQSADAGNDKDH